MHTTTWESVRLQDQDGDGFDESIEDLEGQGGVRYMKREVFSIGATEIKKTSEKRLGEYDSDGRFVPNDH
jgi:hypothetical protein